MTEQTKECSACKVPKPASEFYHNRTAKDGLSWACKVCTRERQRRRARVKHGGAFGPLPRPGRSKRWYKEVYRRAAIVQAQRPVDAYGGQVGPPRETLRWLREVRLHLPIEAEV